MTTHLPIGLYTAEQVRTLDRLAIDGGIAGSELMERAGQAAFLHLKYRWPRARRILVICGVGNNGGDGYVVARLACEAGMQVTVCQVGDIERIQGDARTAADALAKTGIQAQPFGEQLFAEHPDVIIDAMLGTGLKGDVRDEYRVAIETVNKQRLPVLSLDIPSGLDADTGCIQGCAIHARSTVTFIGLKQGMFTMHGPEMCGEIVFDGLRVPVSVITRVPPSASRLTLDALQHRLAARSRCAHKGDFGHVLVVGGNHGMAGAARMAGEAALRVGAGWTSVATRPEHVAAIVSHRPELMVHGVDNSTGLRQVLSKATVVAVGPGLGQDDWALECFQSVLDSGVPMVVDADGLNLLAKDPIKRDDWILTPHPGEAARLLGVNSHEIQWDRFAAAREIQMRYGGVCVLKGNGTLVDAGDDPVGVCTYGNPGMASGGMGDILTGTIAGLLAQQADEDLNTRLQVAARLGTLVHSLAADSAARDGERGMLASDLLVFLRDLVNPEH